MFLRNEDNKQKLRSRFLDLYYSYYLQYLMHLFKQQVIKR